MKGKSGRGGCDEWGLKIVKHLRRVGVDRTILYRNLGRTYTMKSADRALTSHAEAIAMRGTVKEAMTIRKIP